MTDILRNMTMPQLSKCFTTLCNPNPGKITNLKSKSCFMCLFCACHVRCCTYSIHAYISKWSTICFWTITHFANLCTPHIFMQFHGVNIFNHGQYLICHHTSCIHFSHHRFVMCRNISSLEVRYTIFSLSVRAPFHIQCESNWCIFCLLIPLHCEHDELGVILTSVSNGECFSHLACLMLCACLAS